MIRNWLANHGEAPRRTLQKSIHAERLGPGAFAKAMTYMQLNGEVEEEKIGRQKIVRLVPDDEVSPKQVGEHGYSSSPGSVPTARARSMSS